MSKTWFGVLTHVAVLGVGWAVIAGLDPGKLEKESASNQGGKEVRSGSTRARQRLLDRHETESPAHGLLFRLMDEQAESEKGLDLPPEADRAAACRKLIETWMQDGFPAESVAELKLRFKQWVEVDPYAALYYWERSGIAYSKNLELEKAGFFDEVTDMLAAKPASTLMELLSRPPGFVSSGAMRSLAGALGRSIGSTGGAESLRSAMEKINPPAGEAVFAAAAKIWPESQLAALEEVVKGKPTQSRVEALLARMKPDERLEWLRTRKESKDALGEFLQNGRTGGTLAFYSFGGTYEERASLLEQASSQLGEKPMARSERIKILMKVDLDHWMKKADESTDGACADWRQRFRAGELPAGEMLNQAKHELKLSDAESGELKKLMFQRLAAVQPTQAYALVSDLPLKDRESWALETAKDLARSGDMSGLNELISLVPVGQSTVLNDRFQVWIASVEGGLSRYGDSYQAWIESMPKGLDRDLALSAMASRVEAREPERAAQLRALKTLPTGWKPGNK